jgi:cytochrome P450
VAGLPYGHPLQSTLVTIDPPVHTRVRKLAQKAFTSRQAGMHADALRSLAHALIDEFVAAGRVDLAAVYCSQIPIRAIAPILGVSMGDAARLREWGITTQMMIVNGGHLTEAELLEQGRAPIALDRYVRALIDDRRARPRDERDLVTNLIYAEGDDGERVLDDTEIVGVVTVAINGSSDTAATTMGHCIHSLLVDRSRWEELRADPSLVEYAIEETLRTRGPARTLRRDTTREVVLGGVRIPAGARLAVHVGSGSRDATVFPDPETFDLHRDNVRQHLGFGRWTHFCLGAPLARVVLQTAMETLIERLPSLRLVPGHKLEYIPSYAIHVLTGGLVAEWDT